MTHGLHTIHATTIALAGRAVLLRGQPGSGKSDLALRLIEEGAALIADDRTQLRCRGGALWASAPEPIRDLMEVRGLGILRMPALAEAPVALLVDLVAPEAVERCPEPRREALLGVAVPAYRLDPHAASAPAKVRLALRLADGAAEALA